MEEDWTNPPKSTPAASGSSRVSPSRSGAPEVGAPGAGASGVGASGAGAAGRGRFSNGGAGKPAGPLGQAWLNLVVWYPFLLGGGLLARRVVYDGREVSQGGKWSLTLPKQCWCCGTQQRVESQQISRDVRTYDVPPAMLLLGAVVAVLLLLIGVFKSIWIAVLGLVLVGAGAVLLMLKSWREPVRMVIWSCDAHADDLRTPDLVIYDNELYLFTPSASLAEAATAELMARRRKGRRYSEGADDQPVARSSDAERPTRPSAGDTSGPAPPSIPRPLREELPPIKMDD
jgi:uncharacterized membrane protein